MSQQPQSAGGFYTCPMHSAVRHIGPGKCPVCDMALQPEGARFGLARHILSGPRHLLVVGMVMLAIIAAAAIWS